MLVRQCNDHATVIFCGPAISRWLVGSVSGGSRVIKKFFHAVSAAFIGTTFSGSPSVMSAAMRSLCGRLMCE